MKESTSKEKILKKIRDALVNGMPTPYEGVDGGVGVFHKPDADYREEAFAEALIRENGRFVFCKDVDELTRGLHSLLSKKGIQQVFSGENFLFGLLKELNVRVAGETEELATCGAAVTGCEALVVRHGSVVLSSRQLMSRRGFITPPVHIVVATNKQLLDEPKDVFRFLQAKYGKEIPSLISFVTGPGRTADIEKNLVIGAHGPKELYIFMLDISATFE